MKRQSIYHRYAKISKANGNSKVERFFKSLKYEFLNYAVSDKAYVKNPLWNGMWGGLEGVTTPSKG